jgi:hypothetical protein
MKLTLEIFATSQAGRKTGQSQGHALAGREDPMNLLVTFLPHIGKTRL